MSQGSSTDVFVVLLEWTIKDILKPSYERGKSLDGSLRAHILDNCQKVAFTVEGRGSEESNVITEGTQG